MSVLSKNNPKIASLSEIILKTLEEEYKIVGFLQFSNSAFPLFFNAPKHIIKVNFKNDTLTFQLVDLTHEAVENFLWEDSGERPNKADIHVYIIEDLRSTLSEFMKSYPILFEKIKSEQMIKRFLITSDNGEAIEIDLGNLNKAYLLSKKIIETLAEDGIEVWTDSSYFMENKEEIWEHIKKVPFDLLFDIPNVKSRIRITFSNNVLTIIPTEFDFQEIINQIYDEISILDDNRDPTKEEIQRRGLIEIYNFYISLQEKVPKFIRLIQKESEIIEKILIVATPIPEIDASPITLRVPFFENLYPNFSIEIDQMKLYSLTENGKTSKELSYLDIEEIYDENGDILYAVTEYYPMNDPSPKTYLAGDFLLMKKFSHNFLRIRDPILTESQGIIRYFEPFSLHINVKNNVKINYNHITLYPIKNIEKRVISEFQKKNKENK